MLHTKFRGNLHVGMEPPLLPEKKIFDGFLPYRGVVAILVM